ncbi:MAG: hypothetical protein RR968_00555, partial [Vagococcus sp.]
MSYKQELYTEIKSRLSRFAVFISLLLVIFLSALFLFIEHYQINADTKSIASHYQDVKKQSFNFLTQLNKKSIPNFLNANTSERQLYSQYYEIMKDFSASSDLVIINDRANLLFMTGDIGKHLSGEYLDMIIKKSKKSSFIKIQRGLLGKSFLLFFSQIPNSNSYSIIAVHDSLFNTMPLQYGTHFAIADNYDNVLAKNSLNFIQGDLEKIVRDILNS